MAILQITPSYTLGTGVPLTRGLEQKSGETGIVIGSVLTLSSGQLALATTGPTTGIVGIALQAYNSEPGQNQMNSPAVTTGPTTILSFAVAIGTTIFASKFTNNSATYIAPATADIGVNYGLTKQTSGIWTVDKNITGASACVTIVGIDIGNLLVYWKFMSAAIA